MRADIDQGSKILNNSRWIELAVLLLAASDGLVGFDR
jgi:hypothetical protein